MPDSFSTIRFRVGAPSRRPRRCDAELAAEGRWARCTAAPRHYLADRHVVCSGCLQHARDEGLAWELVADLGAAGKLPGFAGRGHGFSVRLDSGEMHAVRAAACDADLTVADYLRHQLGLAEKEPSA